MRDAGNDAIVVGSGPNGLAAAIVLARAGRSVVVYEAATTWGGGLRTEELTLPGFRHDVCATSLPLAAASPFFRELSLDEYGMSWVHPDAPLAHPLDDGTAVLLERSVETTAAGLGADGAAWQRIFGPLAARAGMLTHDLLGPLRVPRHPIALARFGALGLLPARTLARAVFTEERARALFAGLAAHSMLALDQPVSAAIGLVLGMYAHAVGWPFVRGGAQVLADALAACLREASGEVVTGQPVVSLDTLPVARQVLLDLSPCQVVALAGERLNPGDRRRLCRYRYGPGVFKVDWALDGPIPWRAPECRRAGVVHLGGTLDEIAAAEWAATHGRVPERPFVLLAQPSLFDPTRAPAGRHTAWAYCHVPPGCEMDMTELIEAQVERFAPGFRDRILARHTRSPREFEAYNPNYVGGDVNGGVQDLRQLFTRPVPRWDPYRTSDPTLFICSASTPPGGGVHGMCGYHAARSALRAAR